MEVKEHPEWSEDYSAIDGIAKGERPSKEEREKYLKETGESLYYKPAGRAVRSDVEEILAMSDTEFDRWYLPRRDAVIKLLEHYGLFSSIPDLRFSSEESKCDMTVSGHVRDHLEKLKKGLEYLTTINVVRGESKGK